MAFNGDNRGNATALTNYCAFIDQRGI
jgi:2-keto-4-pentenoate hydratase/2-oxohepta-3-ene-1,7-dioic acid hydratase in catechol pathway